MTARTTTWLPDRLNQPEVALSMVIPPLTVAQDHPLMVVRTARLDQAEPLVRYDAVLDGRVRGRAAEQGHGDRGRDVVV